MKNEAPLKYMELRNKLEYYRKQKKLTQENVVAQLASRDIIVDRSSVSHWESGVEPNFKTLCALAEIYGVSIDDLKPGYVSNTKKAEKIKKDDSFETVVKKFAEKEHEEHASILAKNLSAHRFRSFSGIESIHLDYINSLVGKMNMFDIDIIPVVISGLREKGYLIFPGEIGFLDSTYFRILIPKNPVAAKQFENDLTGILLEAMDDFFREGAKTQGVSSKAQDARRDYMNDIYDLSFHSDKKPKYECEFHFFPSEIDGPDGIDLIYLADKNELASFLNIAQPDMVYITDLPGGISKDNYDSFIRVLKEEKLPDYHIYWIENDNGDINYREEDFAYSKKEFIALLNSKKREYFCFYINDETKKKEPAIGEYEKLFENGKAAKTENLETIIKYISEK